MNLDTTGIGSGQLRLIDIISHKIYCVNSPETLIDALAGTSTKSYRLEEIPLEQVLKMISTANSYCKLLNNDRRLIE